MPNMCLLLTKFIYPNHLFPESRDQFVFAHESTDILLCGGNVSNKSNELWRFNPLLNQWSKLIINSITPEPRYGHTGILHNNKFMAYLVIILNCKEALFCVGIALYNCCIKLALLNSTTVGAAAVGVKVVIKVLLYLTSTEIV